MTLLITAFAVASSIKLAWITVLIVENRKSRARQ
jgi:hypothetical protein